MYYFPLSPSLLDFISAVEMEYCTLDFRCSSTVVGLGLNGHGPILAPRFQWADSPYMVALLYVQGWILLCKVQVRVCY